MLIWTEPQLKNIADSESGVQYGNIEGEDGDTYMIHRVHTSTNPFCKTAVRDKAIEDAVIWLDGPVVKIVSTTPFDAEVQCPHWLSDDEVWVTADQLESTAKELCETHSATGRWK
jgi:hypothetical protein